MKNADDVLPSREDEKTKPCPNIDSPQSRLEVAEIEILKSASAFEVFELIKHGYKQEKVIEKSAILGQTKESFEKDLKESIQIINSLKKMMT